MYNKKTLYFFASFFVIYEMAVYLSNDMIMPAMVSVVSQYNAPMSSVATSLSLYIIGGSILQIFLGPTTDIIGKRKVLIFGNILFLIATVLIPFSQSINQFLYMRFFQGMGLGFIFIGYALVHELFDDVAAVKLISILSNISIFAPLLGPLIGAFVVENSSWQYVFIISGIFGLISLIGLYKFMPVANIAIKPVTLKSYKNIVTNKNFMFGIMINALATIPTISWIGLSPIIIIEVMHLSFATYIVYQSIILGGYIIGSILIQILAGRIKFYTLITYGNILSFIGIILAYIFDNQMFIIGMFLFTLGLGFYTGPLIRIALKSTTESINLSSSIMSLLLSLIMAIGLEITNNLCKYFNYSLKSYTIINLVIISFVFILTIKFAINNRSRLSNAV